MAADLAKLAEPLLAEMKARIDAAPDVDAKKEARDGFVDELSTAAKEIFTASHQTGFNAGKGEATKLKAKADEKLKKAEQQIADLTEQLESAKAAAPDVAAIEAKANAKAAKLEKELEATKSAHAKDTRERLMKDARADLEADLVAQGYRPRAAKAEVLRLVDEGKVRLADDGSAIEYVKLDDPDSVYGPPRTGAKPHDALVKELRAKADPLDILSGVDHGAGGRTGQGVVRPGVGTAAQAGPGARVTVKDENGEERVLDLSPELLAAKRGQLHGASV
jgi:hypothetical protein